MCNHAYTADYGSLPRSMGKRCPYPEFFRSLAAAAPGGMEPPALPVDRQGACLFHSGDLDWKRANDLPGAFLRLVGLLDEHGTERHYDFAEFVFAGAEPTAGSRPADPLLRIADTTFQKQAHFTAARFADRVEMECVRFPGGLELDGAAFARNLTVTDTYINGAGMSRARFERTWFVRVEIDSYALFDGARFTGTSNGGYAVNFQDTIFRGLTNFSGAVFELRDDSTAAFERTRFEEFTDFRGTRFNCHTEFRFVTFADVTDFIDTAFELVGSSARYVGAGAEFTGITVPATGVLTFRSSDAGRKLFSHDVEMTFIEKELAGTVYFENVNLTGFVNGSRNRLMELAREGRVQIGTGCIKYRLQTPVRTVLAEEGNAPLVVELCQTFANYFTGSQGLNLGVEIVARDQTRASFFYYSDEDISEAEFLERLAQAERGLWNLLTLGSHEQVLALASGDGAGVPAASESAVINAVDGLSALLGTFFRVGARIALGRWREDDTRALLGAIRFNETGFDLRAGALHRTLVARYTQSTLIGLNRLQNAQLLPIAAPGKVRILFLGANSMSEPMDLEKELSRIERSLRLGKEAERLELKQVWAATVDTLMQAMLDQSPAYVHFSGHGVEAGIVLRDEAGEPRLVPGEALASLFELFRDTVRCVVLNACYSAAQGHAIRRHVPHVIGMSARIPDAAAVAFSTGFYAAIGAGKDVPFAFRMGKARVHMEDAGGEDLLTLL
ncbi:CHAT domain-containing protein [bacterium JGI 053]|nr:CHAT domain-containing protein [bacterium JGI 053]